MVVKRTTVTGVTELNGNSQALRAWLKQNNPYYADIEINEEALNVSGSGTGIILVFPMQRTASIAMSVSQVLRDQPNLTSAFTVDDSTAPTESETSAANIGFTESGAPFNPSLNQLA